MCVESKSVLYGINSGVGDQLSAFVHVTRTALDLIHLDCSILLHPPTLDDISCLEVCGASESNETFLSLMTSSDRGLGCLTGERRQNCRSHENAEAEHKFLRQFFAFRVSHRRRTVLVPSLCKRCRANMYKGER
jgi:hypothetical protein